MDVRSAEDGSTQNLAMRQSTEQKYSQRLHSKVLINRSQMVTLSHGSGFMVILECSLVLHLRYPRVRAGKGIDSNLGEGNVLNIYERYPCITERKK